MTQDFKHQEPNQEPFKDNWRGTVNDEASMGRYGNSVLSTELITKLATVKSLKADTLSVSLLSELLNSQWWPFYIYQLS